MDADPYSPPNTLDAYREKANRLAARHNITIDEATIQEGFANREDIGDLVAYYEPPEPDDA